MSTLSPWTIAGWLIVAILATMMLVTPIIAILIIRQRRKMLADFERRRAQIRDEIAPLNRRWRFRP
jgi:hypothetical protein